MSSVKNRDVKARQRLWCGVNVRMLDGGVPAAVTADEAEMANDNDCTKLKDGSEGEFDFGS